MSFDPFWFAIHRDDGNDIPKVFFSGIAPTTKAQGELPLLMEYRSKRNEFRSYVTLKVQGNSTTQYPKKNFTVKMYKDSDRTKKDIRSFEGWGGTHKYCLKANWADHSHARNIVCARLWGEVIAKRDDYGSLPKELRNSPNNGAVDGFPIKLYVNGVYQGLYTWNIPKDAWMFGMDEDNENHFVLCAETNTNGVYAETPCNFRALWDGVNENYWSVEVGTNCDVVKNSLNALIACVKDTGNETFKATIGNHLDIQSAIDYYIHQYIIYGIDGLAKNMLLYTYDGSKWFCGAYDMDTVLGASPVNDMFFPYNSRVPEDCAEQFSLLWSRIEELYAEELTERYFQLRKSVYTAANIITHFERFTDIIGNDLYAEDGVVYPDIPSLTTNNIQQIREYVTKRLEYCDIEFNFIFAQIGYLESHGNEILDTGISGGTNASYEMKMAVTEGNGNWGWFVDGGTKYPGYENNFALYSVGGQVMTGMPTADKWLCSLTDRNDKVVTYDGTTGTLKYGDHTKVPNDDTVAGLGWGDVKFTVFRNAHMKLYYLKMYTDGELVRDFVPVRLGEIDECCMYDRVTETIFRNSGTGAFTGG